MSHLTTFLVGTIVTIAMVFVSAVSPVRASTTDGTIDASNRYAWSENAGWIDFGTSQGNIHITDSALTGYAWGENIGWISLNCSNDSSCGTVDYNVTNTSAGVLGGHAWSENLGWIQFAPTNGGVTISSSGVFSGYAWGENIGWISFNCSNDSSCATVNFTVTTDWRPSSARSSSSSASTTEATQQTGGGRRSQTITPLIERAREQINADRPVPPPTLRPPVAPPPQQRSSVTTPSTSTNAVRNRLIARMQQRMVTTPKLRDFFLKTLERLDRRLGKSR